MVGSRQAVRRPSPPAGARRPGLGGPLTAAFRFVIGAGIAAAVLVSAGREAFGQVPGVGHDVCDRTYQVSDAIVTASGAATCAHITLRHVREITSLNLRGQGIASLSAGDFDGLVRLHTLDLSDNVLTALPQGVFDELLLLRTLHLDGNLLRTLPARLFDRLFMLEKLTLDSNPSLALQAGMFAGSSRFAALEQSVDLPPWAVDAGQLESLLNGAQTVEQFVAGLPALYKERFAMVFASESQAREHVSGYFPRIVSWGGDGRFTFAWNTDPGAPTEFRDVVEFLRRGDFQWSAGVIDFSGATPRVTEPESCQTCHGPLNKPLWGAYLRWRGTEHAYGDGHEDTRRAVESTDPRIEPLDFSRSLFFHNYQLRYLTTPGYDPYVAASEEAGNVMAWRHAEVLFRRLKSREDFRPFAERLVCTPAGENRTSQRTRRAALRPFTPGDHNPAVLSNTNEVIQGGSMRDIFVAPDYYYHAGGHYGGGGQLGGALVFLVVADLWDQEPIVRGLYRGISNADIVQGQEDWRTGVLLYYDSGSATAEDELIMKAAAALRIRKSRGTGG